MAVLLRRALLLVCAEPYAILSKGNRRARDARRLRDTAKLLIGSAIGRRSQNDADAADDFLNTVLRMNSAAGFRMYRRKDRRLRRSNNLRAAAICNDDVEFFRGGGRTAAYDGNKNFQDGRSSVI